jgi:hypothetical protein
MSKHKNNFLVKSEKELTAYKIPYNQALSKRIFESNDEWIEVSNSLVTIKLFSNGSFEVHPNPKGNLIDETRLDN